MWVRGPALFTDDPAVPARATLFGHRIEPGDIAQGQLGDCWLMCALSACAEFPALIKKLFPDGTKHANGLYRVKLCLGGTWRTLTIDDFFPCDVVD